MSNPGRAKHYADFYGQASERAGQDNAAPGDLPLVVVIGNCQAESLRVLLDADPGLRSVRVPPVFEWGTRDAEAAARLLLSGSPHDGPVTLTAAEAPTFEEIAGIAAEVGGRPVELRVLGDDEWVAARVAAGQPEFLVRFTLGMHRAAERGFFAGTGPELGRLLGREPRSVRDLLEAGPAAVTG